MPQEKSIKNNNIKYLNLFLLSSLALFMAWSAYKPHDYTTWWQETAPVFIGLLVLFVSREKTPLTYLIIILLWLHSLVLLLGAHYTYAEVPLFEFGERNNYDKVGHFMQGFVPAMVARELLLRTSPLRQGKWLSIIIVLSCLGISAMYELIEWSAAILSSDGAEAFLGTQGDVWDTQKDMMWAGIGAIAALICLGRLHDKVLKSANYIK